MKRAILRVGDKSTNGGVVTQGIDDCTHDGVPITYIGAKVWCDGCMSEGYIAASGPHQTATMMGKHEALDGDICICECVPSPVMLASQDNAWHSFEPEELLAVGFGEFSGAQTLEYRGAYDERVRVLDGEGKAMPGVPYHITSASGSVYKGLTDASGYSPRVYSDSASSLDIAIGIRALERWSSTP